MSKKVLTPIRIMDGVDLEENQVSTPIHVQWLDNLSLQIEMTGTPDGSFSFQVSNKPVLLPDGSVRGGDSDDDWITLTSPAAVTVTDATPIGVDINQTGFAWFRLKWADSASTTATATARLSAKAI